MRTVRVLLFAALAMAELWLAGVACQSDPAYCPTADLRPVIADLGVLSTAAIIEPRLLDHTDWRWEMHAALAAMDAIASNANDPNLSDALGRVTAEYRKGLASGDVGSFATAASLLAATSPPDC